jgi:hypothetical protein
MLAVADALALSAVAIALCDEGPARRRCPPHAPLGYLACFLSHTVRALQLHGGSVDAAAAQVTSQWAWSGVAVKSRSVHPALLKARSVPVACSGAAALGACADRARRNLDLLGTRPLHTSAVPPASLLCNFPRFWLLF